MSGRDNIRVTCMAPGMLTEALSRRDGCALAFMRLAEQAAGAGRLRSLAFVMRHRALHGVSR